MGLPKTYLIESQTTLVTSFNGRSDDISLSGSDITEALSGVLNLNSVLSQINASNELHINSGENCNLIINSSGTGVITLQAINGNIGISTTNGLINISTNDQIYINTNTGDIGISSNTGMIGIGSATATLSINKNGAFGFGNTTPNFGITGQILTSQGTDNQVNWTTPVQTVTLATLPTALYAGQQIFVSDATGAHVTGSLCFWNSITSSWIDVTTGVAVV